MGYSAIAQMRASMIGLHPQSSGWIKWVNNLPEKQLYAIYCDRYTKGAFDKVKKPTESMQMDIFEAANNMERIAQQEEDKISCSLEYIINIDIGKGSNPSYVQIDEVIDGKRVPIGSWKGTSADMLYFDFIDLMSMNENEKEDNKK